MEYQGLFYRALNPAWAREPLLGEGAARYGGRFNPKGTLALYTAPRPETAMHEANQVGAFQPVTLIACARTSRGSSAAPTQAPSLPSARPQSSSPTRHGATRC